MNSNMRGRFASPSEKKSWESCSTAGSSHRQPSHISPPKEGGRMFCSKRNVWQGSGEIWRSLTDARFHPPKRRVEGLRV